MNETPSKIFRRNFSQKSLKRGFYKKIRVVGKNAKGVDRVSPILFEEKINENVRVISKKCLSGTYKFSPYLELLKLKGRGKQPRVMCIPAVRDRLVLQQLKETLFEIFPKCVRRKTSRDYIQEINDYIALQEGAATSIVYGDIKSFYDSINRSILFEKIGERIKSKRVLLLLKKAVESPVMPKGYRKSDLNRYKAKDTGIPQGLAISNILASIYLHDFDGIMKKQGGKYFRYVDDILIICGAGEHKSIEEKMKTEIEGSRFQLELHSEGKTFSGDRRNGFKYLGYYFKPDGLISVSEASVEKYIEGIASKFTAYSRKKKYTIDKDTILTQEQRQAVFIRELNQKITGSIDNDRRYGWLFYYGEINDLSVLHRIDKCVDRFFERLKKDFPQGSPLSVKRLSRAFHEAKYSPDSGYIHDYRKHGTALEKQSYLISKGKIGEKKKYGDEQIEALYADCKSRELSELENDERNIYPLA